MMSKEKFHIAVGVILNEAGDSVLISRRPEDLHMGGYWEFPGGKLHPGETVTSALVRELEEELGLTVECRTPLIQIPYSYPEHDVLLDVWQVSITRGTPTGMEGQEVCWVSRDGLHRYEFPPANKPVITALNLPDIYGITPDLPSYDEQFLSAAKDRMTEGLKMVQFRTTMITEDRLLDQVLPIRELCTKSGCRLIMNGVHEKKIMDLADGVQVPARILKKLTNRPVADEKLFGASCHNREELDHAVGSGADFAVLSPVKATTSHDGAIPLGWDSFSELVRDTPIPVYALGGMRRTDLEQARQAGAQGLAMISGLW